MKKKKAKGTPNLVTTPKAQFGEGKKKAKRAKTMVCAVEDKVVDILTKSTDKTTLYKQRDVMLNLANAPEPVLHGKAARLWAKLCQVTAKGSV